MNEILSFIYSAAPVVFVILAMGMIFGLIKMKTIGFFLLFLLLLPFLGSAIVQAFRSGFSGGLSWKAWLILILVLLVVFRVFVINKVFRR